MLYLWSIRWVLLHLLLVQLYIQYIHATWPSSDNSSIYLLGLFKDDANASNTDTTSLSVHSRAMFKAAIQLSHRFNISIQGQSIGEKTVQTGGTVIGALSSTCRMMSNTNIIGIIGPTFSREAPVIAALAESIGIPTISYAATDPKLSDKNAYPAFHRTIPSDNTAALAIVKLFLRYNWTSCIVIYQSDEFGIGGVDAINKAFINNSLTLTHTLLYDLSTLRFRGDLASTLLTSSTRIVILWAEQSYITSILQQALDNDVLGPQFLWILCSSVSLNSFNQTYYPKLIGIITVEPTIGSTVDAPTNTTLLNAAYAIWQQYEPETFPGSSQVINQALFAFDATWVLIQALQTLCSTSMNDFSSCLSVIESSFCYDRRFLNTDSFMNAISSTQFLGVSGPIQFSNNTTDRISGNYYIAKNIQPSGNRVSYASVLQWSGSGDWETAIQGSVIVWPGNTLTSPSGLPGLHGVTLRIGVAYAAPYTMTTEVINEFGQTTTKFIGYVPDLIDILKEKMGFTSQIILVPSNQTYDDLVQAVADNVYDIVVGDVTITAKRRVIVDFSNTVFDNSLRIIVRETTSVKVDLLSFMRPFSPRLWLVILGALLYSAILFCILERRGNEALKEKSRISAASMSVWYCFGTMTGYGVDFHVETAAGRLLSVGLYILSIILVASYTANLTSNLTLSKASNIISGIDDIKAGKIQFSRIGILVGSSIEDYYLREVSGGSRNFYPLKSEDEIYSALWNNIIDASIMDTGALEYATRVLYCNLTLVGSDFDPSAYGIAMRKEWLYGQALDINILSLRESGDLDVLKRKWFQGAVCGASSTSTESTSTGTQALAGLFLIFGVISVLSLFLFAWLKRLIIKDYMCKRLRRKDDSTETSHDEPSKNRQLDFVPSVVTDF